MTFLSSRKPSLAYMYASAAHAALEASSVATSVPSSVPCQIFLSLRKYTERISMKFVDHEHIK